MSSQAKPVSEADRELVVQIGTFFQEVQNKGEAAGCLWKEKKDGDGKVSK